MLIHVAVLLQILLIEQHQQVQLDLALLEGNDGDSQKVQHMSLYSKWIGDDLQPTHTWVLEVKSSGYTRTRSQRYFKWHELPQFENKDRFFFSCFRSPHAVYLKRNAEFRCKLLNSQKQNCMYIQRQEGQLTSWTFLWEQIIPLEQILYIAALQPLKESIFRLCFTAYATFCRLTFQKKICLLFANENWFNVFSYYTTIKNLLWYGAGKMGWSKSTRIQSFFLFLMLLFLNCPGSCRHYKDKTFLFYPTGNYSEKRTRVVNVTKAILSKWSIPLDI